MEKLNCKLLSVDADTNVILPKDCIGWVFKNSIGVYTHLHRLEDIIKGNSYFGAKPQILYLISPKIRMCNETCYVHNPSTNKIEEHFSTSPKYVDLVIASNDVELCLPDISDDVKKHFIKTKGSFEEFEVQMVYTLINQSK